MAVFIALLRAVNVGGTGRLPMKSLAKICSAAGFRNVQTYIQAGNAIFRSDLTEAQVVSRLEDALNEHMGKAIALVVREAHELRAVLSANPFPNELPSKVAVLFCSVPIPAAALVCVDSTGGEQVTLGCREIYIHYPGGMGRSKLKLPKLNAPVTARNINTVAKLVAITSAMIEQGD